MFCDLEPCREICAHIHCADCSASLIAEGGGGFDGRGIACYIDDSGANARSCVSCDSMLCGECQKREHGTCMLCMAEVAAENRRAVDLGKVYRDERCDCDHRARDPHCKNCGGLRRWMRAVA